jgi:TetR/AcrR family transcriptional repressor of lmrAB and yxaGH operons
LLRGGKYDACLPAPNAADAFGEIRRWLVAMLTQTGTSQAKAQRLALLIVSAYEGALLQARIAGSVKPVADTAAVLVELVREEVETGRGTR